MRALGCSHYSLSRKWDAASKQGDMHGSKKHDRFKGFSIIRGQVIWRKQQSFDSRGSFPQKSVLADA